MRTVAGALQTILDSESAQLALLVKIERLTKSDQYFTNLDTDIVFGGNTYRSSYGLTLSDIFTSGFLDFQNVELIVAENDSGVQRENILAGEYEDQLVTISLVDWGNTGAGSLTIFKGRIGEISYGTDGFVLLNLDGLTARPRRLAGEYYTPVCRNALGDDNCGFNINSTRFAFTVAGSPAPTNFKFATNATAANDYFTDGIVEWLTGDNVGLYFDIRKYANTNGLVRIWTRTQYDIQTGDTGYLYQGCPKTLDACRDIFDNVDGFRGEPYAPPTEIMKAKKKRKGGGGGEGRPKNPRGPRSPFL